jgi:hypothetical protein
MQAAQSYQMQLNQSNMSEPAQAPGTGPASAPPASPQSFLQKAGKFVTDNLPTVGAVALPALADIATGGLALPANAALAAAGGALGQAGKQAAQGQGLTSGDDLKNDLSQGVINGVSGLAGGVLGKVGGKILGKASSLLGKEADDTAVQSLGLTNGNRNSFFSKTGQTVSDFLKEHGLSGGTADDVSAAHEALQNQYNSIARTSGVKVPVSDLRSNVLNNLGSLAEDATQEGKAALNETWNRYNDMLGDIPKDANGNIDIGELTKQKANIQSSTKFASDSTAAGTQANQILSKSFKDTVNEAADKAGLTAADGTPLSQIGQKLNKFNTLADILAKKEPGQVGTSAVVKLAKGAILPTVGGLIGDKEGGTNGALLGGAIGLLGDSASANPAVLAAVSGGLGKLSGVLGKAAAPSVVKTVAGNAAAQGAAGLAENGSEPAPVADNSSANSQVPAGDGGGQGTVPSPTNSPDPTADPLASGLQSLQSGQPLSTSQYTALMSKVGINPKLADYVTKAYQASNPASTQGLGVASSAAGTLQGLYDQAGGAKGPLAGGVENALSSTGYADKAVKSYNQQADALGQEIISQVYGTGGTSSDRNQVLSLIPQITDSPETAASKMQTLRTLISQRLQATQGATPSTVSASNGPSLAGARP